MELKREQIIKALECCKGDDLSLCRQCEYHIPGDPICIVRMADDALSLIKELTEENERLNNRITCQVVLPDEKLEEIKNECLERVELDIKTIQADTVKKMQKIIYERLDISVEGYSSEEIKSDVRDMVDRIVTEMLEVAERRENIEKSPRDCSTPSVTDSKGDRK